MCGFVDFVCIEEMLVWIEGCIDYVVLDCVIFLVVFLFLEVGKVLVLGVVEEWLLVEEEVSLMEVFGFVKIN